jgi:riboflavin kinase/FMN adenylyltransferase
MAQMTFIRGLHGLQHEHKGCVATIGAFDGIHRGHQCLLEQVKALSLEHALPSVVVLFEPQPNEFFQQETAPARLMRLREKVLRLNSFGIDKVLCLKFDQSLRGLTAEKFVDVVLVDGLGVKQLIVGDDFRFGCDRKGDFGMLQTQGGLKGFNVCDTKTKADLSLRISSTRIRQLLAEGKLHDAAILIGEPYSTIGRVIYGKQLGRTLGFPTLNIALGRKKVALQGVFAVDVQHLCSNSVYQGVANVGSRPTVDGKGKAILEVHLFDTDENLYGEFMRVSYCKKLRDEQRFDSITALKEQIELDAAAARDVFA